jgi:hypothetical protein
MKQTLLLLHKEMEEAIDRLGNRTTETAITEQCYQIATDYWRRAKHEIRQTGFPDDAAEIEFFKNIKVKFTGLLEFYLLLYRYQVHAGGGTALLEQFRQEETLRTRKFRETHAAFIDYYEQGRTEWDDLYFLRRKFNRLQRPPSQVYDRATDLWTNGDWILTLFHGNTLFEQVTRALHS